MVTKKNVTRNRPEKKGEDIAAFVIKGAHVDTHTIKREVEIMVISLSEKTDKHLICILYRPPSLLLSKFLQELQNLLIDSNAAENNILLCGNFNVDILDRHSKFFFIFWYLLHFQFKTHYQPELQALAHLALIKLYIKYLGQCKTFIVK